MLMANMHNIIREASTIVSGFLTRLVYVRFGFVLVAVVCLAFFLAESTEAEGDTGEESMEDMDDGLPKLSNIESLSHDDDEFGGVLGLTSREDDSLSALITGR